MDINVFYEIMVCLIDTMNTHKLHNFNNLYFTSINNQVRYRINVRFKILNTSLVNILYFFSYYIIVIFYILSYNVISSE